MADRISVSPSAEAPAARLKVRAWHGLEAERVLEALGSSPDGLSFAEAQRRLEEDGPNALTEKPPRSPVLVFLDQFKSPLIVILLGAAAVAYFLGKGFDVWVILAVVLLNTGIGAALEYRASGAIAALKRMTSPRARVVRDGELHELSATEVVVGDVLDLEGGDRVAADARLLRTSELRIDESGLTGESLPAEKSAGVLSGGDEVPLGDRSNMAYMNTAVSSGRGRAVVVATGMATEMGRLANEVAEAETIPPIQRRLARFGSTLGLAVVGIVAAVMGVGLLLGRNFAEMFYVGVSLAVAAIPEGLPLVVTALFAIGVSRMARRNALVRHLPAVESLGSATVICSDKTGTLTRNEMTVERLVAGSDVFRVTGAGYAPVGEVEGDMPVDTHRALRHVGLCARLCNDAVLEEEDGVWHVLGDPTEGALHTLAGKLGVKEEWERVGEIPFSSERKWMATLHRAPDGRLVAYAKGAFERLSPMACTWMDADGEEHPWDDAAWQAAEQASEAMASEALRVLAFGLVWGLDDPEALSPAAVNGRLTMVGLAGLIDPARPEAVQAVATCQSAGIRVVMITGDHRATAVAIAGQLGILRPGGQEGVLTGSELEGISDGELEGVAETTTVYARVSPSHKLRIVRALQRHGELVAMTGDGVNDAPAVAQADIGIAMGITGTEVAKGAADMVLADDNFATIVAAVEEGRVISDNMRKVIGYLMAACVANLVTITVAIVTNLPLPQTAVMLLWVNMVATGMFDKTLALEAGEPGLMERPPQSPNAPLISVDALVRLLILGVYMASLTLAVFSWELGKGATLRHAQTEAFTVLAAFQFFSAFVYRSPTSSLFALKPNFWMLGALVLAVALQLLAVTWGPFQMVLGTESLTPSEFVTGIAVGASILVASEIAKALLRR